MSKLLLEYDDTKGLNEVFRAQMETLLRQLLSAKGIVVHSISSRTKERRSIRGLEGKWTLSEVPSICMVYHCDSERKD